jgi:hypothetical protein
MRKSRAWIFGAIMLAMLLALGVSCAKKTGNNGNPGNGCRGGSGPTER